MAESRWHVDRAIPIGFILALMGQTLFFTYIGSTWKSETDSRLLSLEKYQSATSNQETRIVVLEQQFGYIREDLAEIKDLIRTGNGAVEKKETPQ